MDVWEKEGYGREGMSPIKPLLVKDAFGFMHLSGTLLSSVTLGSQ